MVCLAIFTMRVRQREYNAQLCSYQTERRTRRLKGTGDTYAPKTCYTGKVI